MENELKMFIPITKVDEERRLVYGRLTEEVADSSGETFDYETSKPFFEEWMGYFQKATDGKSYGNLRAMHDVKKAVGFLPTVSLNDKDKAVDIVGKVVDDEEWKKTLEGVYTGFSQGGSYVRKWHDGKSMRYTAKPSEASLVDYPALKTATFQVIKSEGIVEDRAFQKKEPPKDEKKEKKIEVVGDLKKYAGEEISDVRAATGALETVFWLYQQELTDEGDAGQAADLKAVIDRLKNFIASEIKEDTMNLAEIITELKKLAGELTDELIKAHSKETMGKIQGIHDHSVSMGAKCNTGKAEDAGDLQKIQAEKDEALKKIGTLEGDLKKASDERDALKTENEELKKKAEPPKGAVKEPVTVTKQDDTKGDDAKKIEDQKDPLQSIKKAHSDPIPYRLQQPLR